MIIVPQCTPVNARDARRLRTHCKHGHEYTPENIYSGRGRRECMACRQAAVDRHYNRNRTARPRAPRNTSRICPKHPNVPRRKRYRCNGSDFYECRLCAREREAAKVTPQILEEIKDALKDGRTVSSICGVDHHRNRIQGTPRIVSVHHYLAFLKINPIEAKALTWLRERHRPRPIIHPGPILVTHSWLDTEAMPAIAAAVPRSLPHFMQQEIRQELAIMVWSGEIGIADIKAAARKLLTKQYSGYDLLSKFGHRSLDAPISHNDDRALIEKVSQGLWG